MISNLKLQSISSELDKLSAHIMSLQKNWDLPRRTGIEINLVLDELVTNIIHHGHPKAEDIIDIQLHKAGDELTIEVINSGPAFDPTSCKEADTSLPLKERQCGGLGIHLVRELSDSCSYTRLGDKNIFSCKKTIPQESRPTLAE
jgi:anti-sigma regulatory factor (Ser/Thr protein kinase)